MVLTVCFVLSPVIGLFCHRRPADMVLSVPGRANKTSAGLDASVEASGPHDFTVRSKHLSSARLDRSQAETHPAITSRAPNAAASTASRPASVTIAIRPSVGWDGCGYRGDLGKEGTEIFLQTGLDRANHIDPAQQFSLCAHVRRAGGRRAD